MFFFRCCWLLFKSHHQIVYMRWPCAYSVVTMCLFFFSSIHFIHSIVSYVCWLLFFFVCMAQRKYLSCSIITIVHIDTIVDVTIYSYVCIANSMAHILYRYFKFCLDRADFILLFGIAHNVLHRMYNILL